MYGENHVSKSAFNGQRQATKAGSSMVKQGIDLSGIFDGIPQTSDDEDMEKAEAYIQGLLTQGVVRVFPHRVSDHAFIDASIDGIRFQSVMSAGKAYISALEPSSGNWSYAVPYSSACLVRMSPAAAQGEMGVWRLVKGCGQPFERTGDLRLSEAGARTLVAVFGVPMSSMDGFPMPAIDHQLCLRASAAFGAMVEWCQRHRAAVKSFGPTVASLRAGEFVV